MRRRSDPAPLWFYVAVALLLALLAWMVQSFSFVAGAGAPDPSAPHLAIFGFLASLVSLIWTGVQVAYQAIVIALQWSVKFLWTFATATYNILIKFGKAVGLSLRKIWEGTRALYEHVLRPAWDKFWRLFDRVRRWLDRVFGPILRYLEKVRAWITDFYTKYVRPFVDAIGIARKVLRVFSFLGLDWARALDRKLAELQERIQAPFRFAIQKINELVNIVNRVITLNGLIQRLALVRSIERDIRYVSRAFVNWRDTPLTPDDYKRIRESEKRRTLSQARDDLEAAVVSGDGYHRKLIPEMAAQWRLQMERLR